MLRSGWFLSVGLLLACVLAAPAGLAHGGGDLPPLRMARFDLPPGQEALYHVFSPDGLRAGSLFVVSIVSQGPGTAQVALLLGNDTVAEWGVPADGETQVLTAVVPTSGDHHVAVRTAQGARGALFIDFADINLTTEALVSKDLPLFPPHGAAVFPIQIDEPGRHRITMADPKAHDVQLTLLGPDAQTVIARSPTGGRDDLHVLDFPATAGDYTLLVEATWTTQRGVSPSHVALIPLLEGPLPDKQTSFAGVVPMLVTSMVATAVAARRRDPGQP